MERNVAQPSAPAVSSTSTLASHPRRTSSPFGAWNLAPGEGVVPRRPRMLHLPELRFERVSEQTYVRLDPGRYRYKATAYEYDDVLSVSSVGFVTTYPRLWEVVSRQGGS